MHRRSFLATTAAATAALLAEQKSGDSKVPYFLAVKDHMIGEGDSLEEKYQLVKDLGFDGVEVHSPGLLKIEKALAASRKTDLPIHGCVNARHWKVKLSSPDEAERVTAVENLKKCLNEAHELGGSSVLLVPGVVNAQATQKQAWERSIIGIQKALPLAAKLGVHIILENVWNGMFYDPKGPNTQSADRLANYIDEVKSPWLGSYFDIGNHQRFGKPAEWIKTLGRRIVKLDVKDWGVKGGFGKIGEGDVDWKAVRASLKDIGYRGWATAEVGGGKKERLAEVLENMRKHLVGA